MAKTYPPVVVVDENDNEVGLAMLADVWREGLYHRVVAVYIEDERGRMLLQLRGPQVGIYPNCWDQAAGGHVDEGYDYEHTAVNELAEELGLHNLELKTLGTFRLNERLNDGRINNQFERAYVARVAYNVILNRQADEVSELRWFTPDELKAQVTKHAEKFTPGLLYGLKEYFPKLIL